MEREIKFRFWDKIEKKMRYPVNSFPDLDYLYFEDIKRGEWCDKEFVSLQYTGLKDKNGKEIYEGDILIFDLECFEVKGVVEYIGNGFWIRTKKDGNFMPDVRYREVIGNIYENPDLLSKLN